MFEEKSQATPYAGQRLLAWIHDRVMETTENGSTFIGIENGRITWVNYEKNCRLRELPEESSSADRKSSGPCMN